jgi:ribosomal-protein-alanine N-acetyltransferase
MSAGPPATPTVGVRATQAFDVPVLARLHAGSFDPAWSAHDIAELLAMPGAFGLVALQDAAPVGFLIARAAAGEAEIITLAVLPPARRRGIGRMLLDAALAAAAGEGAERIYLEVAEGNAPACALYLAAGFRAIARRPDYYRRQGAPAGAALVMERPLQALPGGS